MKAPDIIYTDGENTYASAPVYSNTDGNIKYIRADLAEQPETDLLEESYMRGFAQGAKEERERMLEDIKEIHGKAATEFAVHLVRTNSEPDCTTAKCGIRYALNALLSWLKANGYDVDAKE